VGDNAETALIELVDFNEVYGKTVETKTEAGKRTRRAGGRKRTTAGDTAIETAPTGADATVVPSETPAAETTSEEKPAE
jgi:large subunit ribosomal protein L17